jgi:hypothetical protein
MKDFDRSKPIIFGIDVIEMDSQSAAVVMAFSTGTVVVDVVFCVVR